jgi:hypothetical protein
MGEIASAGRTVIYVSHNLGSVQSLCQRAIWLQSGRVRGEGPSDRIIAEYLDAVDWSQPDQSLIVSPDGAFEVTGVRTLNEKGEVAVTIQPGSTMTFEISYIAHRPIYKPYFWLGFSGHLGNLFTANMLLDGRRPEKIEGEGALRLVIPQLPLMPNQQYVVRLGGFESNGMTPLFQKTDVAYFRVVGSAKSIGMDGEVAERFMQGAPSMLVPYIWEMPDGQSFHVDPLHFALPRAAELDSILNRSSMAYEPDPGH